MSVRRRTYAATAGGPKQTARRFTVYFADHNRIKRSVVGFASRADSAELERKLKQLASARAAGNVPPADLARYADTLPATIRGQLAAWGMIDAARLAMAEPVAAHVDDFRRVLVAQGHVARHVSNRTSQVLRLAAAAGIRTAGDATAERVTLGLARLRDGTAAPLLRKAGIRMGRGGETGRGLAERRGEDRAGIGLATSNNTLAGFKHFTRWMIESGRAADTPELRAVLRVKRLNAKADPRHERRAMRPAELAALVTATAAGFERFGMAAAERALLYRLAAVTGLRAGELRQLRRCDLALGVERPTFTVPARIGKNRKAATLPLVADVAAELLAMVGHAMPAAAVLPVPPRSDVVRMLRADLADARAAFVAAAGGDATEAVERAGGDFLAYRDAGGRVLDFHSLRHTFITDLAAANVPAKVAQELARHSTVTLTLDVYTHVEAARLAEAVAKLPDAAAATGAASGVALATGTADARPLPPLRLAGSGGSDDDSAGKLAHQVAHPGGAQPVKTRHHDVPNNGRIEGAKTAEYQVKMAVSGDSGRPGSNRQHSAWKADALPIELRPRGPQSRRL